MVQPSAVATSRTLGERPRRFESASVSRLDRERALLEVARHVQRPALVPEVALELAEDGGRGIARELRAAPGLEAVDGLDQAEARDLQQVVERLVGVGVAQGEIAGQRQEALHELLPGGEITVVVVSNEELSLSVCAAHTVAILATRRAGKTGRGQHGY